MLQKKEARWKYSLCSWISSSTAVSLLEALRKMHMKENMKKTKNKTWNVCSASAAASFDSAPSMNRHWACGVRGGYSMIMSNRLPPLPSPCPRLSLRLSQLLPPPPPSSSSTDIRSGCAIMPKAFERNPWQPSSREPCPPTPPHPPTLKENNRRLLIVDSHKGLYRPSR